MTFYNKKKAIIVTDYSSRYNVFLYQWMYNYEMWVGKLNYVW